jgi:hypothetical protein
MTSHEGKHYTCYLPVEETKTMKSIVPQNATNVIVESERKVKPKEPDELLEILKDQCFYRVSVQVFLCARASGAYDWSCVRLIDCPKQDLIIIIVVETA